MARPAVPASDGWASTMLPVMSKLGDVVVDTDGSGNAAPASVCGRLIFERRKRHVDHDARIVPYLRSSLRRPAMSKGTSSIKSTRLSITTWVEAEGLVKSLARVVRSSGGGPRDASAVLPALAVVGPVVASS